MSTTGLGRRTILRAGVVGSAWLVGCAPPGAEPPPPGTGRFRHGIASFDPAPDRVVLWTQLADATADETIALVVARDEALTDVVARAHLVVRADDGWTIAIEVDALDPGTAYHYAFETATERSVVGRARTAPAPGAARVRLAFTTCASYAHGFLHVYARIAEQERLEAVVHLGDYIYEYGDGGYGSLRSYDPPHEVITLADYRRRYAHYRLDPDVARLHARHPMIVTWDDHELANNAHRGGAREHDPATEGSWAERLEAATRAHREWLPRRETVPGSLYRVLRFSELVDLFVLDARIEGRSPPPRTEEEVRSPERTILGVAQRERFLSDLRASTAAWKIVAHGVQLSPQRAFWNGDAWDGYAHDRRLVLEAIRDADIGGVIFVCGDGHKSFADELPLDPTNADAYDPATGEGSIAVELMTPAASSPNVFGEEARTLEVAILESSPHTRFVEVEARGYWMLDLDAERALAELRFVDDVEDPTAGGEHVEVRFEVLRGQSRFRR